MNYNVYPEIKPGKKFFKRIYISIMMWVVGRGIQAAARVDKVVKAEFLKLGDDFSFSLGVVPDGPFMIVGTNKKGKVKYMGWNPEGKQISLKLCIKNIEAAFLVFSFQESTAIAFAHNRFIVDGDLPASLSIVKVLDRVEIYLLPKFFASMAVKRYPKWSELPPLRKYIGRVLIYLRVFTIG